MAKREARGKEEGILDRRKSRIVPFRLRVWDAFCWVCSFDHFARWARYMVLPRERVFTIDVMQTRTGDNCVLTRML